MAAGATGNAALNQLNGILSSLGGIAAANGITMPNVGNATGGGTTPAPGGAGTANTAGAAAGGQGQPLAIPATGKIEMRVIDGVARYFGPDGKQITAYQYTDAHRFSVNLDYRDGIATGLANLSRIFGARQERLRLLSNALANDANVNGAINPVDLQRMSMETTTTQQLSEIEKKIFDAVRDSISAWTR